MVWAGWRLPGLLGDGDTRDYQVAEGQSVFEAIEQSGLPDHETYIVWRGDRCFALMNLFPYTSGHLLVLPKRASPSVLDLDDGEHRELWDATRDAVAAVEKAFNPQGVNVGINQGRAAGGSILEHLHVHVIPRWSADTNFMTTAANARVLPDSLASTWEKLVASWPDPRHGNGQA